MFKKKAWKNSRKKNEREREKSGHQEHLASMSKKCFRKRKRGDKFNVQIFPLPTSLFRGGSCCANSFQLPLRGVRWPCILSTANTPSACMSWRVCLKYFSYFKVAVGSQNDPKCPWSRSSLQDREVSAYPAHRPAASPRGSRILAPRTGFPATCNTLSAAESGRPRGTWPTETVGSAIPGRYLNQSTALIHADHIHLRIPEMGIS